MEEKTVFEGIKKTIDSLATDTITEERKMVLDTLVNYLKQKRITGRPLALNFICTHNSRRSHLSQIWAQTLAHYVGLEHLSCYSGGTEATALYPVVATTLADIGFQITRLTETDNPVYAIKFTSNAHPIIGFSKTFDHPFNPEKDFAAIMTCSSADAGCPFVGGSDARFAMTFEDPKAFDNTPQQEEKYRERSTQIATELLYVMQKAVNP